MHLYAVVSLQWVKDWIKIVQIGANIQKKSIIPPPWKLQSFYMPPASYLREYGNRMIFCIILKIYITHCANPIFKKRWHKKKMRHPKNSRRGDQKYWIIYFLTMYIVHVFLKAFDDRRRQMCCNIWPSHISAKRAYILKLQ